MVRIEGYTLDELLSLPLEEIDGYLVCGRPVVLRVGSAEILGQFRVEGESFVVEIAHIDGGGEGVLPALWRGLGGHARRKGLQRIEWIVHAAACARPNLKLRRVLEKRGYERRNLPGHGEVLCREEAIAPAPARFPADHRVRRAGPDEGLG